MKNEEKKNEEKSSALSKIASLKKDIMMMRIKKSMGETMILKDYRAKKKEVAQLFTKIKA